MDGEGGEEWGSHDTTHENTKEKQGPFSSVQKGTGDVTVTHDGHNYVDTPRANVVSPSYWPGTVLSSLLRYGITTANDPITQRLCH